MTALPQHAARAAQETREKELAKALIALSNDLLLAEFQLPLDQRIITLDDVAKCRYTITACLSHLDDIEARLPGSARQGQLRDVAEGDPAYLEEQGR